MIQPEQISMINASIEQVKNATENTTHQEYIRFLMNDVGLNAEQSESLTLMLQESPDITSIEYQEHKAKGKWVGFDGDNVAVVQQPIGEVVRAAPVEFDSGTKSNESSFGQFEPSNEKETVLDVEFTESFDPGNNAQGENIEQQDDVIALGFEGVELEDNLNNEQVIELISKNGGIMFNAPFSANSNLARMRYLASDHADGLTLTSKDGKEIQYDKTMAIGISDEGRYYLTNKNPGHNYKPIMVDRPASVAEFDPSPTPDDKLGLEQDASPVPKKSIEDPDLTEEERARIARDNAKREVSGGILNFNMGNWQFGSRKSKSQSKTSEINAISSSAALLSAAALKDLEKAHSLLDDLINPKSGGAMSPKNKEKLELFQNVMADISESLGHIKSNKFSAEEIPNFDKINDLTKALTEKLSIGEGKMILFAGVKAFDSEVLQSIKESLSSALSNVFSKVAGVGNGPN